jgi:cyclic beta-1,2-glucan synthetase
MWLIGPGIAWWLSRPLALRRPVLNESDVQLLRRLARRTWRFFDTFINPGDNFLPPDNYQEHPVDVVAHRTSPTNIGFALLCNLAAYDFGYISGGRMCERIARTLDTMDRLPRHRGHFYNWYDTVTLQPLPPLYISTVDSGNLQGYLRVLAVGLEQLDDDPIIPPSAWRGIADTLLVITDAMQRHPAPHGIRTASAEPMGRLQHFVAEFDPAPRSLAAVHALLHQLLRASADLVETLRGWGGDPLYWAEAMERQCRDLIDDLVYLAPWVRMPTPTDLMWRRGSHEQLLRLDHLRKLVHELDHVPTLRGVAGGDARLLPAIEAALAGVRPDAPDADPAAFEWLSRLEESIVDARRRASERMEQLRQLAERCRKYAAEMDFSFLYDKSRNLFTIGYNVSEHRRDAGFYDLLASEARLGSYIAVADGTVPQEHWFSLGRSLTSADGGQALLSWSGSMFEYLMPQLVMPTYPGTLLDQTCRAVVQRQIEYGRQRGVPWGVSESGYYTTDIHLNYQYRAFGVPGLGLKRGLLEDLVIAPYATVMAVMIDPSAAVANLRRLEGEGALGAHGMYEAIDYTPARVPRGQSRAIVRSFMAHHQGMSFLALLHLLRDQPMQERFEGDPQLKAVDLLLQERVPQAAPIFPHASEVQEARETTQSDEGGFRVFDTPHTASPAVHLLSNGRYHVVVSAAGGGYSRWQHLAVTRWQEDTTRDNYGTFVYVRHRDSGRFWSVAHQPTLKPADKYEAIFSQAKVEFRRKDGDLHSHVEISVSSEDDIELRRITLDNRGREPVTIDLTTYAEVVLNTPAADAAHPAFSNLFVQTEILPGRRALLCTRRARSSSERPPWMFHLMTVEDALEPATYETSRDRFIGRGRSVVDPAAMEQEALSNTQGSVLDPIVSIRQPLTIRPEERITIDIVTGVAPTREAAVALVEKYHDRRLADRVFELAWTHSHVILRQLGMTEAQAQRYGKLASWILYPTPRRRAESSLIARNRRGQSGLWGYGISGDLPIVLLRIANQDRIDLVREMVTAHAYWRMKGLIVDLIIWNEDQSGYRQTLHDSIMNLIAAGSEAHSIDRPGGIFVRRVEQISDEDKILMESVARVVLSDAAGSLEEQVDRRARADTLPAAFVPTVRRQPELVAGEMPQRDLVFFNGHGGFTRDGREYIIITTAENPTPAPWSNVIANPWFGTVVTESGGGYTWCENAHEYRLTPWYNDPVTDLAGEAFYIRDEETGRFWSPAPLPARGSMPYTSRHGFGYSVFEYGETGIFSEMWTYVAMDAPVKFVSIRLRNASGRDRRVSVTGYLEWVLGEHRTKAGSYVVTEIDPRTKAMFARNPFAADFAERVAFFDVSESQRTVTADRTEFLGRNGTPASPAALRRSRLSGRTGGGLDPCGAMQVMVDLARGQEREIVFMFGSGRDLNDARTLVQRFRGTQPARQALEGVWRHWGHLLGAVNVQTPAPAVDYLVNGWLLYQVVSCRLWGRSGFYQSGGAYGFRDQLQDVAALLHAAPHLIREQLLRAASRQFKQGDVQHWWHPPLGRGVRTRFSDDYLWLPFVTARYVEGTGDTGVLDEQVRFLDGRPVNPDEESYYDLPMRSDESASLYEHCLLAIRNGLKFGQHGLPLMGVGDWNDGMNMVGHEGRGESVWLAFFLYDVLRKFIPIAERRGDAEFVDEARAHLAKLRQSIETEAWDGAWYRRAYFDNGEPLGSSTSPECQIDSLPQSWSILSEAGEPQRRALAMSNVEQRLVRKDVRLIQLFDPAFDNSHLEPGYIKGYVPGVRENGGQYTHAAIWAVMAQAMLDPQKAWEWMWLINPITHGDTEQTIATYRVEPYVVAADVYTNPQHLGRGGWTWYTGSAGWMYRLLAESLLGLRLEVDHLRLAPVLPADWTNYTVHYRFRETVHHIVITRTGAGVAVQRIRIDGQDLPGDRIPLRDDRQEHHVEVELG